MSIFGLFGLFPLFGDCRPKTKEEAKFRVKQLERYLNDTGSTSAMIYESAQEEYRELKSILDDDGEEQ